jgi:predicted amidohydrolase
LRIASVEISVTPGAVAQNTEKMVDLISERTDEGVFNSLVDGVTCGLMTCYDIRFPEVARSLSIGGARML